MTLDFAVPTITVLHVTVSVVGIAAGFVVLNGMWNARIPAAWTAAFLAATVATSLSGFLLKPLIFDPPQVIGGLSLLILAVAILALYHFRLNRGWRSAYVFGAVLALYLNVFVAVVQAFQKFDFLHARAPTQTEPLFFIVQALGLVVFVVSGVLAWRRFNPQIASQVNVRQPQTRG